MFFYPNALSDQSYALQIIVIAMCRLSYVLRGVSCKAHVYLIGASACLECTGHYIHPGVGGINTVYPNMIAVWVGSSTEYTT